MSRAGPQVSHACTHVGELFQGQSNVSGPRQSQQCKYDSEPKQPCVFARLTVCHGAAHMATEHQILVTVHAIDACMNNC